MRVQALEIAGYDVTKYVEQNGYSVELNDIDDESSGRTLDGVMHRSRITMKVKIGVSFLPLPNDIVQGILKAVEGVFFNVRYIDPYRGMRTMEAYCGTRKIQLTRAGNYEDNMWSGLSFSLIER